MRKKQEERSKTKPKTEKGKKIFTRPKKDNVHQKSGNLEENGANQHKSSEIFENNPQDILKTDEENEVMRKTQEYEMARSKILNSTTDSKRHNINL
jgi:hypothetical protein